MKKKISITIDSNTLDDIDLIVDNIYIRNRSQAIEHLVKNALGENKTAVILAGGEENKLKVDNDFSPTVKIKNNSVIELAVKKLRDNGFKTIFVVARNKVLTRIFEILKEGAVYGVKINYIEEKHGSGTASSLRLLKGRINSNFIVVYGDIIFSKINIEELWKSHLKHNLICTLMLTTSPEPSTKGTCVVEGNKILKFTQKPKKSDIYLVFSPIFAAEPELLEYEGNSLETEVFPLLAEKGLLNGHLSSEKEIHIHNKKDIKKIK